MTTRHANDSRSNAKAHPVDGGATVPALFVYQGEVIHDRGEMLSLTQERLKELLHYDPITGIFTRLVTTSQKSLSGSAAGSMDAKGYLVMSIDGRFYKLHRLAWFYVTGTWPEDQIDHRNRLKNDNRFDNLRDATNALNKANGGVYSNSSTGLRGVRYHRPSGKFQARCWFDGRRKSLGYFTSAHEAYSAYCEAAKTMYGEFARDER